MKKNCRLYIGIVIMLLSAFFSCVGQLCWKLSAGSNFFVFLLIGLCLYGAGAVLMIIALKFGELSVLHPMLSFGYILSILLGKIVLNEAISVRKTCGICIIVLGLVLLSIPTQKGAK